MRKKNPLLNPTFCAAAMALLLAAPAPCTAALGIDAEPQISYSKIKGDVYLRRGQFASAAAQYEKALASNPSLLHAYFNLAIAYYALKDVERAVQTLEKLVKLDPEDAEAQYNLACLSLYREDLRKARSHFEKARCCPQRDARFVTLIQQGLEFLDQLETSDPSTQGLAFYLLRNGLAPLVFAS